MIQQVGPAILLIALSIVLLVGVILLVIRAVEYQNRLDEDRHPLALSLFFLAWVVIIIVFLCFGLAFCLLPFIFAYAFLQNLRAKQQGFLWIMAMAAEKKIPLAPAVEAYAEEVGGYFGDRVEKFAILLSEGVPLPHALGRVPLLVSRQHYPIICTALESGVLARGLREAATAQNARQDLWGAVRAKLSLVLAEVLSGVPWGESLCRRGLIRQSDFAVLQAAERTGNLPWAMREMADSNRRRLTNRLNMLVQTMFPPVVLCFGAMVLFIVVALFLPLIILIRSMS